MGITQVNEVPLLGAKYSVGNGRGIRTYKREWEVLTDDLSVTEVDILNHPDIPRRLQQHPRDPLAICTEIEPDQSSEMGLLWSVKANYTTERQSEDPNEDLENEDDPLLKPYDIRYGTRRRNEIFWKDLDEKAVVNSAEDPFDPPHEIERGIFVIEIVRNELINPEWKVQAYFDAINQDWWRYYRPRTAKMADLNGQRVTERGMVYWSVRYLIEINFPGWKEELLDRGLRERVDGKLREITVGTSNASSPVLLDGFGRAAPRPLPAGWEPKFKEYRGNEILPFSALNLNF